MASQNKSVQESQCMAYLLWSCESICRVNKFCMLILKVVSTSWSEVISWYVIPSILIVDKTHFLMNWLHKVDQHMHSIWFQGSWCMLRKHIEATTITVEKKKQMVQFHQIGQKLCSCWWRTAYQQGFLKLCCRSLNSNRSLGLTYRWSDKLVLVDIVYQGHRCCCKCCHPLQSMLRKH